MNENTINKKNFSNLIIEKIKSNLKNIIIFVVISFVIFLSFQIYLFYQSNKIKNNSVSFFNIQNIEEVNEIIKPLSELSEENNFYGLLSKLQLIEINIKEQNIQNAIILYLELLDNNNLESNYKSAIASKASYQFIDINFKNLEMDYSDTIKNFILYIDDELMSYQEIKLELNYLLKILEVEKSKLNYLNFNEAIEMYEKIMNSDIVSSSIKERINKIHEYFLYK